MINSIFNPHARRVSQITQFVCLTFFLILGHISFAQTPTNVFISEYMEGASNDKFIEIYNGSGASLDFTNLRLVRYSNGSSSGTNINISGTGASAVADDDVWVVANTSANSTITSAANQTSGSISHNGDDAYELVWLPTNAVLDVFGYVGCDPGSEWTGVGNGTRDNIVYRQSTYCSGASNPTGTCNASSFTSFTSSNWVSRNSTTVNTNSTNGIGYHDASCGTTTPIIAFSDSLKQIEYLEATSTPVFDSVVLSASNLSANVLLSVSGDFSISSSASGPFNSSYTVNQVSGSINEKVYIRFNAGLSKGIYTNQIVASDGTGGADSDTLELQGIVSTKLYPGDLAVIGYDSWYVSGGDDKISILCLKDIDSNTFFMLGNLVYEYKAAAFEVTNKWYNGNGTLSNSPPWATITYKGNGLSAGDIICITLQGSGVSIDDISVNGVVSTDFIHDNAQYINASSSSPDVLWLMQGVSNGIETDASGDEFVTFSNLSVMGAVHTNGTFQPFSLAGNAGGSRVSRIHPDVECLAISTGSWSGSSGWYGYYDHTTITGSQHAILSEIIDLSNNWTTQTGGDNSDDLPSSTCDTAYSITSDATPGLWVGGTNGDAKNWFNCRNWDNFSVPNNTVYVSIPSGTDSCIVDTAALYSDSYGDSASCYQLAVSDTLVVASNGAILTVVDSVSLQTGGYASLGGTSNSEGGTLYCGGDLVVNIGTSFYSNDSGLVWLAGQASQTISCPTGNLKFGSLKLDNSQHIYSDADLVVSHQLILENGRLYLHQNDFTFDTSATYTGTAGSDRMLVADENGRVHRSWTGTGNFLFPVGDSTGDYTPIELNFTTLSLSGQPYFDPGVNLRDIAHPNSANSNPHITRYWSVDGTSGDVLESSIGGFTCDIKVHYLQNDVTLSGAATESDLVSSKWNGSWQYQASNVDVAQNILTFSGATGFSDFTGLPVSLVSFYGAALQDANALHWGSSSTANFSHFEVELWDVTQTEFVVIGTVEGQANSNDVTQYQFNHYTHDQISYYRLRCVDLDGQYEYSKVIAINKEFSVAPIEILGSSFKIRSVEEGQVDIYSAAGEKVHSMYLNQNQEWKSNLPNGVYIVYWQNKYGKVYRKKTVVYE